MTPVFGFPKAYDFGKPCRIRTQISGLENLSTLTSDV
jgi:hypothetical protein